MPYQQQQLEQTLTHGVWSWLARSGTFPSKELSGDYERLADVDAENSSLSMLNSCNCSSLECLEFASGWQLGLLSLGRPLEVKTA